MSSFFPESRIFHHIRILVLVLLCTGFSSAENVLDVSDLVGRPGVAAWSPDGARVAVVQDSGLIIIDVKTKHKQSIPIAHPHFVSWAPGSDILVVSGVEKRQLLRVAPDTGASTPVSVSGEPAGAYWLVPDITMLVVTAASRLMTIGTPAEVHLVTIGPGPQKEIFRWDHMLPTRNPDIDFVSGWLHARPNALDDTLLVPEYRDPPQFPPFFRFRAVDPYTGETEELFRTETRRLTAAGDWSPDGRRVALVNDEGNLLLWSEGLKAEPVSESSPCAGGYYPAWNPEFDLLHLGGEILRGDGSLVSSLVPDRGAIGFWSPDGTHLALVSKGTLTIVSDIEGTPLDTDLSTTRDKIRTLAGLLHEGLISADDYQSRRKRLLSKKGR